MGGNTLGGLRCDERPGPAYMRLRGAEEKELVRRGRGHAADGGWDQHASGMDCVLICVQIELNSVLFLFIYIIIFLLYARPILWGGNNMGAKQPGRWVNE